MKSRTSLAKLSQGILSRGSRIKWQVGFHWREGAPKTHRAKGTAQVKAWRREGPLRVQVTRSEQQECSTKGQKEESCYSSQKPLVVRAIEAFTQGSHEESQLPAGE